MSIKQLFAVGMFLAVARSTLQISTVNDAYYNAGVVEFRPSLGILRRNAMEENMKHYLEIIHSEEAKNLDIIVFPESTLNSNEQATFVPNPDKELVVPCDVGSGEYHDLLVKLSCAAKNVTAYVVINLTEKEWCSTVPEDTRKCAPTGLNFFNTNVVFDRKGAVISRYRKVHLYGENKNTTFVPEFGWFDTDFGVRFGHFICFDILFYTPAQAMVDLHNIKDFIFPTMWFSQLPFLTAVQIHQAWSYANNVNFLAAGASIPLIGSTGTGIYNGRNGIMVAKMNQGFGERKLYVAQVPKHHNIRKRSLASPILKSAAMRSKPNITLKRDYLQNYKTLPINLSNTTSLNYELCFTNSSLCCQFYLKWQPLKVGEKSKYYHYRLGVYDGLRSETANETNQLKNCALFSCIGEDIMDCGKTFNIDTDVVFENITISATFPKAEEYLLMPNSLKTDMMPLSANHFEWQEAFKKNTHQVRFELNTTTANVMTFSIYGNYYDSIAQIIQDEGTVESGGNGFVNLLNSYVLVAIILMDFML